MLLDIKQVLSQTSLLIVQFSKAYLKTLSWTFFLNGRICSFCVISFKCSINQFLEYCHLTQAIAARLLNNFTFVPKRISKWKFLIIFCYTELLFPRHPGSKQINIFMEEAVQSVQKTFFQKYSEKKFQEDKDSIPRSKQYFRKKMSVIKFALLSVMLRGSSDSSVFSSIARPLLLCKRINIA